MDPVPRAEFPFLSKFASIVAVVATFVAGLAINTTDAHLELGQRVGVNIVVLPSVFALTYLITTLGIDNASRRNS